MTWKDPIKIPPENGELVWIYMPSFPEKWRWNHLPDILKSRYVNGEFTGLGDVKGCVLYWHRFENTPIPTYITDNEEN